MSKHAIIFTSPSMTKQSYKDECDINKLMDKYQKTGLLNHVVKHSGEYGEFDSVDFTDAMNVVAEGQSMFEELPSSARKAFDNDPAKFMNYINDDLNSEKIDHLHKLGLAVQANEGANRPPPQPDLTPEKTNNSATENDSE